MKSILVISDTQIKPDVDISYLSNISKFIIDKRPDIIVQMGDWADMPSLSSYDKGKKSFEGRTYKADIEAAVEGQRLLLFPLQYLQEKQRKNKEKIYSPKLIMLGGNHDQGRIERAIETSRELEGLISIKDLRYEEFGWEFVPFLEIKVIEGIAFSHYFTTGVMGRPVTSPSALLSKKHMSCVMGHVQTDGIASQYKADGKRITAIFSGCSYTHEEPYLGPQGNKHFRGVWMLYDVDNGEFNALQIPLDYLNRKYG